MRTLTRIIALTGWVVVAATALAQPQYQIFDMGVVTVGDTASQGFQVSPGGVAVGRSVGSNTSQAFTWTVGGGLVGLPSLAGRNHSVSNSANDSGIVVGTASTTLFGTSRLPVIWQSGLVSQLPLPAGETLGDAHGVNASGIAVGSVDGGSLQQAVIYNGATATVITQTTATGCFFVTAFGINNSGRIVGQGIDPGNAARNVGIVYDIGSPTAFEVGAIPGANGALAFAVGNGGHVVGSSMMNQGSGTPFIWSQANGIVAIPLAAGTSQGSARAVNSTGWVVGQDSSAFSIPFLWDGTTTYRLADLLPPGSGWDLDMNTSSSALGISDDGIIVGTGVHNGATHGYAMVPVATTPTPTPTTTPTPGPATHFEVIAPSAVGGFTPFNFTVRALDQFNNTATNYTGTVHFTASHSASLPPDSTLINGFRTFSASFNSIGSNRTITATDTLNPSITGTSNNILVIDDQPPTPTPAPPIDIAVTMTDAPDPVQVGQDLTYTITLTNLSPDFGLSIMLTDTLPAGVNFVSATPSQGSCSGTSTVTCNLGSIQTSATVILVVTPTVAGKLSNTATAPLPSDPNPSNNSSTQTTTVISAETPTPTPTPAVTPSATPAPVQALNLSTRMRVQTGNNVGIGGFIITGTAPAHILVRAIGPSLTKSGIPDALADPVLELHGPDGFVTITNDNWRDDPAQEALIIATGIAPTNNFESAIDATPAPGAYTAVVTGNGNTAGVALIEVYDLSHSSLEKLANISTRAFVDTGSDVVIAGFILGGSGTTRIVIRGIGPSLIPLGVSDALPDPTLELRDSNGALLNGNNDWQDDSTQAAELTSAGLAPTNNLESGIIVTLPAGLYTAILAGGNNGTGVGLVEIYDLGAP